MKELFSRKRQNIGLKQKNFIWRNAPTSSSSGHLNECMVSNFGLEAAKEMNRSANALAEEIQQSDKMVVHMTAHEASKGLGAIVLGIKDKYNIPGRLNYQMDVHYRSNAVTANQIKNWNEVTPCFDMPEGSPTGKFFKLADVNVIKPGQYVWIETDKKTGKTYVVVDDVPPSGYTPPVTPGGGGKRKKKEKPCVDCDNNLRENLFGVGSLDERIEGTMKASKIFGDELDKYQRNFEALRGYNGTIKMIQKVLMPVFSGGVAGWSVDALNGKRNDMVKELTKKGGLSATEANKFVDNIVTSMRSALPQAKAVAKNVIAHYEESGFEQKNKDMLRRDISTYVMGTLIGEGLILAGVITAPMLSVLTASIVLSNVRTPFVKKLCVLPDVNTSMQALANAKGWDTMTNYVDGSYTEQVKRTVKSGDVYMENVQNFMKFENAILGGNDRATKSTKKLTPTQRAEYQKKQDHIDRMLPGLTQNLQKLGVAIDGQGNFAIDQAKWAKKEFFTFISFDRKKGTTRRGIKVLMDKRANTNKGRESRKEVPENEDKITAMNEIISNLVAEYNQDFPKKDKFGNSEIRITGTAPNTRIEAYENGVRIADNANFTAGRKKLQERQGRLSAIRELHEVGTEMSEFNRLLRKGEEYKNYLETSDNSYGGTENVNENVYQVAVAGFITEYTSYAEFAKNTTISKLMDYYRFDNAPAGKATPRQLLQEYYTIRLGDPRRKDIVNELIGRPKFRDFMKCLALMAKKCRETTCWKKWNKDLDQDSQAHVDGVKLYIDAVGPEKRRIAITWGMVESLLKQPWRQTPGSQPEFASNTKKSIDPFTGKEVEGPTVWTVNGANGPLLTEEFTSREAAEAAAKAANLFKPGTKIPLFSIENLKKGVHGFKGEKGWGTGPVETPFGSWAGKFSGDKFSVGPGSVRQGLEVADIGTTASAGGAIVDNAKKRRK